MPDNYTDFGESALVRPGDPPYDPPMQIPEGVDWRVVAQVTGMMDRQRENQEKARQQAIRYRGQQEFRRLVAGGMKPEMALREVAVDLFEDDPRGMASVLEPPKPTARNIRVGGPNRDFYEFGASGPPQQLTTNAPPVRQAPLRVAGPNRDVFSFDPQGVATQRTTNAPIVRPERFVASEKDETTGLTIRLTEPQLKQRQIAAQIKALEKENEKTKGIFYTTDTEKKKIADNLLKIEGLRGGVPQMPGVSPNAAMTPVSPVAPVSGKSIPPAAVQYLRANPDKADAFDKKYGDGQAELILGR